MTDSWGGQRVAATCRASGRRGLGSVALHACRARHSDLEGENMHKGGKLLPWGGKRLNCSNCQSERGIMGFCGIHIDVQMRGASGCLFSFKPLNKNFKAPLKSALAELIIITALLDKSSMAFPAALQQFWAASTTRTTAPFSDCHILLQVLNCRCLF